jgi:hypothetical protein
VAAHRYPIVTGSGKCVEQRTIRLTIVQPVPR